VVSVIGFHGDPCYRCPQSRPGKPVLAAVAHGMCSLCWLGATERQRREAIFDEEMDHSDDLVSTQAAHAAAEVRWLEALLALPDPEPEQWGEAA